MIKDDFMQVPPQEMLSRDSVTVSVDAVCFYKVQSFFILCLRGGCQKKSGVLPSPTHKHMVNMGQRGHFTTLVVRS